MFWHLPSITTWEGNMRTQATWEVRPLKLSEGGMGGDAIQAPTESTAFVWNFYTMIAFLKNATGSCVNKKKKKKNDLLRHRCRVCVGMLIKTRGCNYLWNRLPVWNTLDHKILIGIGCYSFINENALEIAIIHACNCWGVKKKRQY